MDELMGALAQSIAHAGPEWATVIIVTVLGVTQVLPAWKERDERRMAMERERQAAELELAREREARKAEDAKRLDQRDKERSQNEGRWLEQGERSLRLQDETNAAINGMRSAMEMNNALLSESKERSRHMAQQVDEMHNIIARRDAAN